MTIPTIGEVLLFSLLAMAVFGAAAEPTHKASGQGIEIVLHSEPCAFKEHVTNLPKRATWHEGAKMYEGCGGFHPMGVALFYWDDRTVVALPASLFIRVVGT